MEDSGGRRGLSLRSQFVISKLERLGHHPCLRSRSVMSKRRTRWPKPETCSPLGNVCGFALPPDSGHARLNAIKHREISIEQDLFSTNEEDELSNVFRFQHDYPLGYQRSHL